MKTFAKKYKKTKPYGFTGKNGYNDKDELAIVINKKKIIQQDKNSLFICPDCGDMIMDCNCDEKK
jgi:hypothetical protein